MEKEQSQMTERILNLTLEIIYLLTGENYIAFKFSDGLVASNLMKTQNPVIEPPFDPLRQNKTKVQEVTSEIIELLTAEVPIRSQDVSVSFFTNEDKDLEGHKDLYKDVMMENRPLLTSPDGSRNRNTPERCPRPLYSRDSTQEHQEIPQDDQVVHQTECRTKRGEETEELYVMVDEPCKEEEIPTEISPDPGNTQRHVKAEEKEGGHLRIKEEKMIVEISTDPGDTNAPQRNVKAEDVKIKVEDIPTEMNTDNQNKTNNPEELDIIPQNCEVEDDITAGSSEVNTITQNSLPVLHSTDLCSGPTTSEGTCFDRSNLGTHRKAGRVDEAFSCLECSKCFTRRTALIAHQRSHSAVKPYSCPMCGKCFSRKSHFIEHERTHTGEKPYSCSECGKRFIQKSTLATHQRIHTAEKPYHCSECGKCFTQIGHFVSHQRTHTGVKPYSCPICRKSFSVKSALVRHQRIHTGEKPFLCSQCGKGFTERANLMTHQRIHTGDRPYSCSMCGRGYISKSNLVKHQQVHNGV